MIMDARFIVVLLSNVKTDLIRFFKKLSEVKLKLILQKLSESEYNQNQLSSL